MKGLLRIIHYEMFKLTERERIAIRNAFEDDNERIRHDQTITEIREMRKVLDFIEEQAYLRMD